MRSEAIQSQCDSRPWIASSHALLAMTENFCMECLGTAERAAQGAQERQVRKGLVIASVEDAKQSRAVTLALDRFGPLRGPRDDG